MIRIFDGNNYYRRVLETDISGLAPRKILTDTINCKDVQIWVWDGTNGNAKRRELYPDYKANRKPVRTDIYAGFETVRTVLSHTSAFQVSVPQYEGDDVVATLALRYAAGGHEVAIYSTDFDFAQLTGLYPNQIFCGARLKDHITGDLVRHYKTWVGDPSDNIRGVPGFGDVTWQRTSKDAIRHVTHDIVCDQFDPKQSMVDGQFSAKVLDWLSDPQNRETFRVYWSIVGFYEVPDILIDKHLIVGVENYAAADAYLKEWMM
jgi:hypothetical protein